MRAAQYHVAGPHRAQDGRTVYSVVRRLAGTFDRAVTECLQLSTAVAVARELNSETQATPPMEQTPS